MSAEEAGTYLMDGYEIAEFYILIYFKLAMISRGIARAGSYEYSELYVLQKLGLCEYCDGPFGILLYLSTY